MMSDMEIIDRGMNCLLEELGVVETERFIAVLSREKFDYTKWQKKHFDSINSEEFHKAAVAYARKNPF